MAFSKAGIIYSLFILASCSSTPVNEKYYLLEAASRGQYGISAESARTNDTDKATVSLAAIELADFLRQAELVIQTDDHQLSHARYHLWAEDLADAIGKALLRDLRIASGDYRFASARQPWLANADYKIYIRFDQFHPDNRSAVTAAGRYWIVDMANRQQLVSEDFYFSTKLRKDGYAQSVAQLRELLSQLSTHILRSLHAARTPN